MRRRLLTSPQKDYDYIRDGLVFWADPDDFYASGFTDRVGSIRINSVRASKSGNMFYLNGNSCLVFGSVEYIREQHLSFVGDNAADGFMLTCLPFVNSNNLSFGMYQNRGLFVKNVIHKSSSAIVKNSLNILSFSHSNYMLNGAERNYENYNDFWNDLGFENAIGGRSRLYGGVERGFKGRVGAVLLYNRVLTNEERLHNYLVDVSRFF